MASVKIYDHLADSQIDVLTLLNAHLPTCLPLYRRIQFQHFTPDSHLLCSLSVEDLKSGTKANGPWIVAYIDRSRRPETEIWTAGSWENATSTAEANWQPQAEELTKALVVEIAKLGVAGSTSQTPADGIKEQTVAAATYSSKTRANQVDRVEYEGHLKNANICIFGAVHERTVDVLKTIGALAEGYVGVDIPYRKYIFDLSGKSIESLPQPELPSELVWGEVQPQHYDLVKSRTMIPRQDSTLRQLPSLALYPKEKSDPISWAFLSPDASLASLHVEPEYRGRRLAKILAAKLFAERMNVFWDVGDWIGAEGKGVDRWAHADVAIDNGPSNGVCKGLNGESTWNVFWVRVDLSKV